MNDKFVENGREDIILRISKATTLATAASIIADVQCIFGFRGYFVFDASRSSDYPLGKLLDPSNLPASLIDQIDSVVGDYAAELFADCAGAFSPVPWDLERSQSEGRLSNCVSDMLRESRLTMGINFPALGISGKPRIVGFVGDRQSLTDAEIDQLNFLMIQMHARLSVIARDMDAEQCPLTPLERNILFSAAEGQDLSSIAVELHLSVRTVQYLTASICRKMQVVSMEHAVAVALRAGSII